MFLTLVMPHAPAYQFYGFFHPNNPHDEFQLANLSAWLEQRDPEAPDRLERVRALGMFQHLEAPRLVFQGQHSQCVPTDTLRALRAYLAGGTNAAKEAGHAAAQEDLEAYRILHEVVLKASEQMGGSLETDSRQLALAQAQGNDIACTAIGFRREKRSLLLRAQEELARAIAPQL